MLSFAAGENLEEKLLAGTEDFSGQERIDAQKQILSENLDLLATDIESSVASLPGIVKTIIGNIRVNVQFEGMTIGIVLEEGKVTEINNEEISDPTFLMTISDNVFTSINEGELNVKASVKSGDISYKGLGFFGKMKSALLTAALKVSGI